eukprot:scaffold67163_cov66-Phaeocystis_antarctica.AAC.3
MQVLRVPYDKLVINYVKRLLPRPFLCTMGESIDMLKGRDKEEADAKEAAVAKKDRRKKWEREREKLEADDKKEAVEAIKKATKKKKKADATAAEGSGSVAAVARARAAAATASASASVATEAEKSSVPASSSE